jgi:hypothetical protein
MYTYICMKLCINIIYINIFKRSFSDFKLLKKRNIWFILVSDIFKCSWKHWNIKRFWENTHQGCQIFLARTYQSKTNKPNDQNIPNNNKYRFSILRALQNKSKIGFRVWKYAIRGRCYDHNFLRFLPILGEKIGVFLKN